MTRIVVSNGHVATAGGVLAGASLTLAGTNVVAIGPPEGPGDMAIDLGGGWLLPGFIDTQVNGGGGVLFNNDMSVAGIAAIAAAHARFGTTALLPTLISDTPAAIVAALDGVDAAIAAGVPGIVGVHIEGPFINRSRKGIHEPALIRPLDPALVEIMCAPRRGVVMLTLAPELSDPADVRRLAAAGVILSAGHSDATCEQARAGFDAGITGVTHLYNAMSPLQHRAPGLVGTALTDDRIWCGVIADGIHVAPVALDLALRVKGADRIMLVTDAMPSVGSADASFMLNGREIRVEDGRCVGADGTLAGANLDMAQALRVMRAATGADIATVGRMASAAPAAYLRLDATRGTLAVGKRADFVVLDAGLQPIQTWIGGARVAG